MVDDPRAKAPVYALLPQSALARAGLALLAFALVVLTFFFVAAAVILCAVAAAVMFVRWWWLSRRLASARGDGAIEGEYTVVERERRAPLGQPRDP